MKRYWMIVRALMLMHLRNREVMFWNLAFPLLLLVIYGVVFGGQSVGGQNYMTWVMPGVIVLNALAFGVVTSSSMMVSMREQGILRRLQATPLPAGQLLAAYVTINVLLSLIQAAVVVLACVVLFKVTLTAESVLLAAPAIVAGVLVFNAIGQIVAGIAPKAGVAVIFGQVLYFSLMFVTDMVMPMSFMPKWIQSVAPYLPSYAVVQLVRSPFLDGAWNPNAATHLAVIAVYAAAAIVISAKLFRWEPRA